MCTSCLYIYLYRTIQRRVDFFYVKDHLPKCFINLHFKDETSLDLLNTSTEKSKREKYLRTIEESFKIYWKLLNCSSITGLSSILEYSPEVNESDETRSDYETVENRCRDKTSQDEIGQVGWMEVDNWHESAVKICSKNQADLKSNRTRPNELGGLRRATKKLSKDTNNNPAKLSFKITFLIVALFSFFTVIFIYFKYYRVRKPCVQINWNKRNSFQRLENTSEIR